LPPLPAWHDPLPRALPPLVLPLQPLPPLLLLLLLLLLPPSLRRHLVRQLLVVPLPWWPMTTLLPTTPLADVSIITRHR